MILIEGSKQMQRDFGRFLHRDHNLHIVRRSIVMLDKEKNRRTGTHRSFRVDSEIEIYRH